jgi:glucosylglycerate phosphorylase
MRVEKQLRDQKGLEQAIRDKLKFLYGKEEASQVFEQLQSLLAEYADKLSTDKLALSEKDTMLIAYGDHAKREGEAPLATLRQLMQELNLAVSSLHILPFYPYSSDDGFSVIDYYAVDPALGDWNDVRALSKVFRLMFDGVINHISSQSAWFQGFLRGEENYQDYFIVADPMLDLSLVTRPRTLPLLSPYETPTGIKHVWTTFSDDQIDLNFSNPEVLLEIIKLLLFYIEQGAQFIRLDAIAFLWKQIGTSCIHLPETHAVIQLMRDVLDIAAPETILITETNVPHAENISYFGDGYNEAQMVYQFPLPPLILHTLSTGNASQLTNWAKGIKRESERTTFFNFTASHDGIGVRPVTGILRESEINALIDLVQKHGGHISYRNQSDGSKSPYELNINYFDAITDPAVTTIDEDTAIARFMVSQAIMLAFIGVPGIYFHSIFGSRNDTAGVAATGRYRSINREKLDADALLVELNDSQSLRAKVFAQYTKLLEARAKETAFHPLGNQTVLEFDARLFVLERISPDSNARILALHNVSAESLALRLPSEHWLDILSMESISNEEIQIAPYQILWLKAIEN